MRYVPPLPPEDSADYIRRVLRASFGVPRPGLRPRHRPLPKREEARLCFRATETPLTGLSATTSNNLALRGHPIRTAPGAGRIPKRPPLPAVAAGLGFGVSATRVYDRARFTRFTRSSGNSRTYGHALN